MCGIINSHCNSTDTASHSGSLESSTSKFCVLNPLVFIISTKLDSHYIIKCGPGSSVGITTDYELDGPGSNPGGDEIFCSSRPALGPTQALVKWYRFFSGSKVRPGRAADHSPSSSAAVMEE